MANRKEAALKAWETIRRRYRYLPAGDEAGKAELLKLGYTYRGMSKKNSQIFVLGDAPHVEEEAIDAIETTFGLERDLQNALRHNIEQLEHGLKITDEGKERHVPAGFIDITAEDGEGRTVVIELKAGTADRETIGQILGYMGDLQRESKKPVRGIIVAADFTVQTKSALGALPTVELKKYGFKFSFEPVSGEADKP